VLVAVVTLAHFVGAQREAPIRDIYAVYESPVWGLLALVDLAATPAWRRLLAWPSGHSGEEHGDTGSSGPSARWFGRPLLWGSSGCVGCTAAANISPMIAASRLKGAPFPSS
jgi:hypothetical protein